MIYKKKSGFTVEAPKRMFKRYFNTWFIVDFLGTIPFDLFIWGDRIQRTTTQYHDFFSVHYWIRVTRMIRIPHVVRFYDYAEIHSRFPHLECPFSKKSNLNSVYCNQDHHIQLSYRSLDWLCIFRNFLLGGYLTLKKDS